MRIYIQLLLILLLFNGALFSQIFSTSDIRTYIGSYEKSEIPLKTKIAPDGSIVIVGYTSNVEPNAPSYNYKYTDMFILKTDDSGRVLWSKILGIDNDLEDMFLSLDIDDDGNIYAVGTTERVPLKFDYTGIPSKAVIYKFSKYGEILWRKKLIVDNFNDVPGRRGDIYIDVKVLKNGKIAVVGQKDFMPIYSDGMITIFNNDGSVHNHKTYVSDENTSGFNHLAVDDSFIYVSGSGQGAVKKYFDQHILKFDYDLNFVWGLTSNIEFNESNSQKQLDIQINGDFIYILNQAELYYSGLVPVNLIRMEINKYDGHLNSCIAVYHGDSVNYAQNQGNFKVAGNGISYFVSTPNYQRTDVYYPNYGLNPNVAKKTYISYNDETVIIENAGLNSIVTMDYSSSHSVYVGVSANDSEQIGKFDIFLLIAEGKLPKGTNYNSNCTIDSGKVNFGVPIVDLYDSMYYTEVESWQFTLSNDTAHFVDTIDQVIVCDLITGINDPIDRYGIVSIFPSPASDYINIQLQTVTGYAEIEVIDVLGHAVLTSQMKTFNGISNTKLPIPTLANGIYYIRVKQNDRVYTGKFVKTTK